MKKLIYFSTLCVCIASLLSNSIGRGTASNQGATNAPGDGLTCSSSNCHGSSNFDPSVNITISQNGESIDLYKPGETYDLTVEISASEGTPSRYGFQMTSVVTSDNSGAGTLGDLSDNAKSLTLNNRTYLEHNGFSSVGVFSASWTAPAEGTGQVDIYAAGIAANGNGGTSGDGGATGILTLQEDDLSSIDEVDKPVISVYPNPTTDYLYFDTDIASDLDYEVYDLEGRVVLTGKTKNNAISLASLQKGMYIVHLFNEVEKYTNKIYKDAF